MFFVICKLSYKMTGIYRLSNLTDLLTHEFFFQARNSFYSYAFLKYLLYLHYLCLVVV